MLLSTASSKTPSVPVVDKEFVKRLSDTHDKIVDGKKYFLLDVREPSELKVRKEPFLAEEIFFLPGRVLFLLLLLYRHAQSLLSCYLSSIWSLRLGVLSEYTNAYVYLMSVCTLV